MIFLAAELTCPTHPKYTGQRTPRTKVHCAPCWMLHRVRNYVEQMSKKFTIQHAAMYDARVRDVVDPKMVCTEWHCGCGHTNGSNLAVCAACGRKPGSKV